MILRGFLARIMIWNALSVLSKCTTAGSVVEKIGMPTCCAMGGALPIKNGGCISLMEKPSYKLAYAVCPLPRGEVSAADTPKPHGAGPSLSLFSSSIVVSGLIRTTLGANSWYGSIAPIAIKAKLNQTRESLTYAIVNLNILFELIAKTEE